MDISTASLDFGSMDYLVSAGSLRSLEGPAILSRTALRPDQDYLRRVAWEIGERRHAVDDPAQPVEIGDDHDLMRAIPAAPRAAAAACG